MKHTIQALVENKFGVLSRIAALFSARGYNIDSLAVGETIEKEVSCVTIVVDAEDERILEQIKKQLNKLIDVITVVDFTHKEYVDRELILVKIASKRSLASLEKATKDCYIRIVDSNKDNTILEICAQRHALDEVIKELKNFEVKEIVRTGKIAIGK